MEHEGHTVEEWLRATALQQGAVNIEMEQGSITIYLV